MLSFFNRPTGPQKKAAEALYARIVAEARNPVYYTELGVPDTVDGRFDMILLHAFAAMRALRLAGEGRQAQAVYDAMFVDLDLALGQMGVGDMSMGKHIRRMQKAFNGRVHAYEAALGNKDAMVEALRRNVYGTVKTDVSMVTLEHLAARVDDIMAREIELTKGQMAS